MSQQSRILIAEDDEVLRTGLTDKLKLEGYEVHAVATGEEALAQARTFKPELILLDLGLPGLSGLHVLEMLRERNEEQRPAVIVLTARASESDKVLGLETGADDYVTKPFGLRELVARVRAHLRRDRASARSGALGRADEGHKAQFGDLQVDFDALRLVKSGREIPLSNLEWKILELFVKSPYKTIRRERFLRDIWGYERLPVTRTVDFHVSRLRSKVETDPRNPRHIKTVHGMGYRFEPEPSA